MIGRLALRALAAACLSLLLCSTTHAGSHLWRFSEFYTSPDGSVQFIEMKEIGGSDSEVGIGNHWFETDSYNHDHSILLGTNLPYGTANKKFLVGTQSYAALSGVPAPDYVVPDGILDPSGDTVIWWFYQTIQIPPGVMPTDGTNSITVDDPLVPSYTTGVNSPTNFAGQTGTVVLSPQTPTTTKTATPNVPIVTATPTVTSTPTAVPTATLTATPVVTAAPSVTATATPTLSVCGDGTWDPGEGCDDGNVGPGDGCSATCTLEPCVAAPLPGCLEAGQAQLQFSEKTAGKEQMRLRWKKVVSATTQSAFGDPVNGATRVALCVYGDDGTLVRGFVVDRGGQLCAGKPCWKAKGSQGYDYKDKTAASDGIAKIGYGAGGAGKGKADAAGANNAASGQTALPTGVVVGLTGHTHPTIQLVTSDGLCLGATMTDVTADDGTRYKARKR